MIPSKRAMIVVAAGLPLSTLPVMFGEAATEIWFLWVAGWALFLVLLVIDGVFQGAGRDFEAKLEAPEAGGVGAPLIVLIRLSHRHLGRNKAPSLQLLLDTHGPILPQAPLRTHTWQETPIAFELITTRRGTVSLDTLWLRWSGPLGLVERTTSIPLGQTIEVLPDVESVSRLAAAFESRRETRAGLRIERYLGDGSEFDSLREFMPGFDRRSIDWKSSAKHTRLFARHFRAERDRQIVVAIDSGRLMSECIAHLPRLDHAIHAGLLLTLICARAGDRIGFYTFDETPHHFAAPRSGLDAFRSIVALSNATRYTQVETNFTLGLTHLLERLHRRSLVIVLSDFTDSITAELMLENLHRLAAKHLVVFVSLADPLLRHNLASPPSDLLSLEKAVVSDTLLRERDKVLNTLRRRGIQCIDAHPKEVGLELLNRYLEIKRRELIG